MLRVGPLQAAPLAQGRPWKGSAATPGVCWVCGALGAFAGAVSGVRLGPALPVTLCGSCQLLKTAQ
jgi:hypothetical protein